MMKLTKDIMLKKLQKQPVNILMKHIKNIITGHLSSVSYNRGTTGIDKQIEKQKVNNFYDLLLNEESSRYLFRILAMKIIMTHPTDYGFYLRKKDLYPPIPFKYYYS